MVDAVVDTGAVDGSGQTSRIRSGSDDPTGPDPAQPGPTRPVRV